MQCSSAPVMGTGLILRAVPVITTVLMEEWDCNIKNIKEYKDSVQAYPGSCPPGLLWNGLNDECDFPENVNCEISMGDLAKMKVA